MSLGRPRWINSHCKLCDRAIRIKSVYRLPDGEYERLLEAQGGRCAICDQAVAGTIAVDHDHATGKVRGLLCSGCNTALGVVEGWYAEHRAAVDAYLRDRPRLAAARHDPAVAV